METIKETNSQYMNRLHDIENNTNVNVDDSTALIKAQFISDDFCAKMCIATTLTLLLSPFAICDVYYASTDTSCVNQNCNDLAINMQSYLLASGIIIFIGIGITNFNIYCLDFKLFSPKKNTDETSVSLYLLNWVSRLFAISWIITGCVLFWAYMDTSKCNSSIKSYLFARFIIFLISSLMNMTVNNE